MARHAGDILRLLAPFPGRAELVSRIALISTLTVLVTCMYRTPEAAISAYVVFFLNRKDRLTSIVLSVAALLLISVVIGLVLLVAVFCLDEPVWRVASMAVLSAGLLFLTSASKLRPVGAILAMIVGFVLDVLGSVPFGEVATRGLLYAWLMIAIPIAVTVGVNLLLAPSPRRLACQQLARYLRVAAQYLSAPDSDRAALDECLREPEQPVGMWLKLSGIEGTLPAADLAALRQARSSVTAILMAVDVSIREPAGRLPQSHVAPVVETLEEMARMLNEGGYPIEIELKLPAAEALTPLAAIVATDLQAAITRFAVVEEAAAAAPGEEREAAEHGSFFLPDAWTNPDHVRYALKTTAAAMFCYVLYMQLNWPGIHTCFITCYLVSLGTVAETVERLTLRIAGCLIGALIGTAAIVFVTPTLTSIGGLMALVMVGTWAAAWVGQGSPRIGYAGFQIAFAFFLCVLQGSSPGFDLTIARDRVIGILLGNVVVYLVFTRIAPVSIAVVIDTTLADLLRRWRRLARTSNAGTRRDQAAQALALHGALEQNLSLIHYEPSWVGPAPAWIDERCQTLARLDALEGPLFLLAERFPGDPEIDRRLRRLMNEASRDRGATAQDDGHPAQTGAPVAPLTREDALARDTLLHVIDERWARIDAATLSAASKETSAHAPT